MTLNQRRSKMLAEILDMPSYYHNASVRHSYCGRHGVSYDKVEGCPGCRQLSVLELANRVYDRHVPKGAGK